MQGRPVRDFLIQEKDTFKSEHKTKNGSILLSSVMEDAFQQKKSSKVIAKPIVDSGHDIEVGDEIFFKHTVLRHSWLEADKKTYSQFMVDINEDIYRVPVDMVWAYKKGDDFFVTDDWVVVKPKVEEDEVRPSGIIMPGFGKEVPQFGEITHIGKKLEEAGYKVGDSIVWDKNSEYEVDINNEKRYRMRHDWIIGKYGC